MQSSLYSKAPDVVILSPDPPSRKMQILLKDPEYRRLHYIQGYVKDANDLQRIVIWRAFFVYILNDCRSTNIRDEEDQITLSCLFVKRFITSKITREIYNAGNSIIFGSNREESRKTQFHKHKMARLLRPDGPKICVGLTFASRRRQFLENIGIDIIIPLEKFRWKTCLLSLFSHHMANVPYSLILICPKVSCTWYFGLFSRALLYFYPAVLLLHRRI